MTKREMFANIATVNADNAEIVAFCEKEIALLDKKANTASSARQKKSEENEIVKAAIIACMIANDRPMTITDLLEDVELATMVKSSQKMTSLVIALKNDGKVVNKKEGKKSFYILA